MISCSSINNPQMSDEKYINMQHLNDQEYY